MRGHIMTIGHTGVAKIATERKDPTEGMNPIEAVILMIEMETPGTVTLEERTHTEKEILMVVIRIEKVNPWMTLTAMEAIQMARFETKTQEVFHTKRVTREAFRIERATREVVHTERVNREVTHTLTTILEDLFQTAIPGQARIWMNHTGMEIREIYPTVMENRMENPTAMKTLEDLHLERVINFLWATGESRLRMMTSPHEAKARSVPRLSRKLKNLSRIFQERMEKAAGLHLSPTMTREAHLSRKRTTNQEKLKTRDQLNLSMIVRLLRLQKTSTFRQLAPL